jgi:hypothetical protein
MALSRLHVLIIRQIATGFDHCPALDIQFNMRPHRERTTEVDTFCRDKDPAPTPCPTGINGALDGRRIQRYTITHCAKITDIVDTHLA